MTITTQRRFPTLKFKANGIEMKIGFVRNRFWLPTNKDKIKNCFGAVSNSPFPQLEASLQTPANRFSDYLKLGKD